MPETKKANCLFCSLQCGFGFEVDAGVPVRVEFDTESPLSKGSLCARGHYNLELLVHPRRFLGATINRRRVPWSSATTKVAGRISEIRSASGPDSIGVVVGTELANEDYDAAVAFARDVLGTKNIAVAYDGNDYPFLMGGGSGDASPQDLDDADCFVLIGDVFWGHPCVAKRIIEARHQSRSNAIFTINPYRTNTDWFADGHITVAPDAEPVALAAILKGMNAQGAPAVAADKLAEVSDLTDHDIAQLARAFREHKKVVVVATSRLGDSTSAYLTAKLAAQLAKAAGGKYAPLFRGGNAIGAFARVGSAVTVPKIMEGVAAGGIKGLLVFGPDISQLYPGTVSQDDLEKLELLAASAVFENDMIKHGDVGLPQSVWTEYDGTYSASFGQTSEIKAVVDPQGDAKPVAAMLEAVASELAGSLSKTTAVAEHPGIDVDAAAALAKIGGAGDGIVLVEGTNPLHRWEGTITGRMTFPQRQNPYCELWVGEGTAAALSIESGASVALSTDRGETRIIATVTDRMPAGLVAVPSYVPDARGLMVWTANAGTRWYDVSASGASLKAEA